jgi:hypothetical protein
VIHLTQKGGLKATYFKTTNFQDPLANRNFFSHATNPGHFTQIDSSINFAPLEKQFPITTGQEYPTQYFSIRWEGFVEPLHTETYWFYVEAFKSSQFVLRLKGEVILQNLFSSTDVEPHSAFFKSKPVNLRKGELVSITLEYFEMLGDSKIKLLWQSDSQPFGLVESAQLWHLLNSETTPYEFTVLPASTNETTSFVADLPQVASA